MGSEPLRPFQNFTQKTVSIACLVLCELIRVAFDGGVLCHAGLLIPDHSHGLVTASMSATAESRLPVIDVTHVEVEPNNCNVSDELNLFVEFSSDSDIGEAYWEIKYTVDSVRKRHIISQFTVITLSAVLMGLQFWEEPSPKSTLQARHHFDFMYGLTPLH